jgi:hypothetical protein
MNNNYYKSPESSRLMKMFWKAAGADQYLLERSTYSDQVKYFCLGGIVIATGVMAALAGGYGIYTIFEPKGDAMRGMLVEGVKMKDTIHMPTLLIAAIFGVIWGLIIFNIDRFIVASTGKGDGTEAITGQEIKSAIPRIIMGMIIAMTISKPIEIRMFKSEIDAKLFAKQIVLEDSLNKLSELKLKSDADKIEKDIFLIQSKIDDFDKKISTKDSLYNIETTSGQGGRTKGVGEVAKDLMKNKVILQNQKNEFIRQNKEAIKYNETNKRKLYDNLEKEKINNKNASHALDGLLERIKLSHEVAGFWVSLFITLLFMVIELTPIFFKMMLIKGPYDYMDENVKELARAEAGIEIEYDFYKEKDGMEKHKVINHAAEVKMKERLMILKAQEEINERVIQEWKKKKFDDIDKNPSSFIDEN